MQFVLPPNRGSQRQLLPIAREAAMITWGQYIGLRGEAANRRESSCQHICTACRC